MEVINTTNLSFIEKAEFYMEYKIGKIDRFSFKGYRPQYFPCWEFNLNVYIG